MKPNKDEQTDYIKAQDYIPGLHVTIKITAFKEGTNELTGEKTVTTRNQPIYEKNIIISKEMNNSITPILLESMLSKVVSRCLKDVREGNISPEETEIITV